MFFTNQLIKLCIMYAEYFVLYNYKHQLIYIIHYLHYVFIYYNGDHIIIIWTYHHLACLCMAHFLFIIWHAFLQLCTAFYNIILHNTTSLTHFINIYYYLFYITYILQYFNRNLDDTRSYYKFLLIKTNIFLLVISQLRSQAVKHLWNFLYY